MAARIAPEIDRLRLALAKAAGAHIGEVAGRYDIGQAGAYLLAMLRNTMPDRVVEQRAVATIFRYGQQARFDTGLTELLSAGLIEQLPGAKVTLTQRGREALGGYFAVSARIVDELWAAHDTSTLAELTARCLADVSDGGATFSVLAPPYVPPGSSDAVRLAEDLSALRFHRFDAHIAAWAAAGLTAEEVQALADDDPRRAAIEDETNRRASTPYAALTAEEAGALIDGLAALPAN